MRTPLGQWGEAIGRPLLHAALLILLISAVIFLAAPETANAQVWVSSGFKPGADAQHMTAYCSTSAVNPTTGANSPAATDYLIFGVACYMTTSDGATITFPTCPPSTPDDGLTIGVTATQTTLCSFDFQPQTGVTYTIHSLHSLQFYWDWRLAESQSCPGTYGITTSCYSDPEGYFEYPYKFDQFTIPVLPWTSSPNYSTHSESITQEETGSVTGTGISQIIPVFSASDGFLYMVQVWWLGTSSAQYPGCATPQITSISPSTWPEGTADVVTITGTGFTTKANATATCPITPLSVTVGTGKVTVSDIQVDSATQISFAEMPDANAPTETATITVGTSPNTVTTTAQIEGCTLPTTESTAFKGWATSDPATGLWEQTLSNANGDSFSGMSVLEGTPSANPGVDTCWISGSPVSYGSAVSGGEWSVGDDNTWGVDSVGWPKYPVDAVAYYRAQGRVPCGFTVYQQMQIRCTLPTDNTFHNYGSVNTLQGNITATTVTSKRAGGTATRRY